MPVGCSCYFINTLKKIGVRKLAKIDESKINHIVNVLKSLEYGSVVITVHDEEITQIDTTDKKRFSLSKSRSGKK